MAELKKKETERKGILDQLVVLTEKVLGGKMARPQYLESEQSTISKRSKLGEEIDNVLASL